MFVLARQELSFAHLIAVTFHVRAPRKISLAPTIIIVVIVVVTTTTLVVVAVRRSSSFVIIIFILQCAQLK